MISHMILDEMHDLNLLSAIHPPNVYTYVCYMRVYKDAIEKRIECRA